MPSNNIRCVICNEIIDSIGYKAEQTGGYVCDNCYSKLSMTTRRHLDELPLDDINEEVLEVERKAIRGRTPISTKTRLKSQNRYTLIVILLIVLFLFLLKNWPL